ncbi:MULTISPECIES: ABC transporter permease [Priestia]|uniref:ABC transporter permease n=1 Tax=Priestia TaxID=2800373 RepID=UPI00077C7A3C|nr:ABC transporter permease [Priestia flexa]MED4590583.1 ABC transporter permease [Priestia flexa]
MSFRQLAFKNVMRNKRTYAAYFLSSAFSVAVFFLYAMFIFHPGVTEGVTKEMAKKGMTAAEYIIYVFSFFFVLYSVSAFLKSRKREFGIFIMHGMSKRQLNTMIFLENMIIGFSAIITGILVGMLLGKLYLMVGSYVIGMEKPLSFLVPWEALALTIAAFTVLFLVISFFTSVFVRTNKLLDLFQSTSKPKPEPKTSIILSLLAAGLLIGGYYLAWTANMYNIGYRFFIVILMTIVGTYFFYTQLSVFLLKMFKKNKRFYWNHTRLITISDLAYRMKDNARMFFMVTIVSTVAFCAIGTLSAMGGSKKLFDERAQIPVVYQSSDQNPSEKAQVQAIRDDFNKNDLSYNEIKVTLIEQTGKETNKKVELISLSDYNAMAIAAREKPLKLKENEGHYVSTVTYNTFLDEKMKPITLSESNLTFNATKIIDAPYFSSGMIGYDLYVIPNELYKQIKNPTSTTHYYGFATKDWVETKDIGLSLYNGEDGIYTGNYTSDPAFYFSSAGYDYNMMMEMYRTALFVALLVGCVFFIAAGSFLYFRLYTDLDYDKRQYQMIAKVGLTKSELNKIITPQLVLLFFVPILVAFVHSVFAFKALQGLFEFSVVKETAVVLLGFGAVQVVYFLFIRFRYLKHIKKAIM